MSQHYIELRAINPKDGREFTVKVSNKRMEQVASRGKGQILEMAHVLPEVLMQPKAIFKGLRRDEEESPDYRSPGWLCYVGRPSKAYSESGYPKEPWPGQVYLAFLNDDKVVYNWAWTKADTYNPDLPEGYEERFKGRIL